MGVGLCPGDFVLDGDPAPYPKRGGAPPNFRLTSIVAKRLHGSLGTEVGLSLGDCVRWGPSPLPQKGRSPIQFSVHVSCGQTAAWIKMPLGTEVGLGPDDIVLDGDPAPLPKKGAEPPIFGPFSLWPNGWMHQDATSYGGRPLPMRFC